MNTNQRIAYIIIGIMSVASPLAAQQTLTWNDCLAEAQKNNPNLISARESVTIKETSKRITASDFYPQIDATAAYARAKTTTTARSFSYGLSATQVIFDGLKTFHNVKAAAHEVTASQQSYRFTSATVRYQLRSAFVNLLRAQELLGVAHEIVKIRHDNYALIELRYKSGFEHLGAVLAAQANVAQAEFDIAQTQRTIDFNQRQLSKKMGRDTFVPLRVVGELTVADRVTEKPDLEELITRNPSVLSAVATTNAALFSIKSAYGNFAPHISASASATRKDPQWPPADEQSSIGVTITLPLFEGGLKTAQLDNAKATYAKSVADEQSARDDALIALEDAWAHLQDAVETVAVKEQSRAAAIERAKIAEAQYSTGFTTFNDWIILQNALVDAKKAYVEAQAAALLAEANWVKAKGETVDYAK